MVPLLQLFRAEIVERGQLPGQSDFEDGADGGSIEVAIAELNQWAVGMEPSSQVVVQKV